MDLNKLLSPESIAVIGASNKEGSLGFDTVRMVKQSGYKGEVYPVNPKYDEILGYKVYSSLESIGKPVDLVVLCVAAKRVEDQLDIAIASGAKSLAIFANCVLENDTSPNLEERIMNKCRQAGVPLMGHNAMGFYNNDIDLRVCGFEAPDEGMKGNIALLSQSGSVFSTLGHNEPQLKFNLMVATGTGHITSLSDYMIYALNQPTTKVLGVYMESVRKPDRFIEALELAAEKRIPVVVMKVGKSELGAEFAQSHTGGMAGDDDAIQAVFDEYGVIRAESFVEMANTLLLFSYYPEILPGGLVAIADSGGERNLLADDAEEVGLEYAKLSEDTMGSLQEIQEYGQDASNPLDPWGTGIDFENIFGNSFGIMLNDENAAIGLISQDLRDGYYLSEGCIYALKKGREKSGKPVVFLTNFSGTRRGELTKEINDIPAPVLMETKPALKSIKNYLGFRDFAFSKKDSLVESIGQNAKELLQSGDILQEKESLELLGEMGFPVSQSFLVSSLDELRSKKEEYLFPAVLKTAVEGILHKADVGGVALNISDYETLEEKYIEMTSRLGNPCIVTKMMKFDVEMIIGMKTDNTFGPVIVVGAGGIMTELLKDRFIILPSTSREVVMKKLESLKTYKLLKGFRGSKEVNIEKFLDAIATFQKIVATLNDEIKEIDINPVALNENEVMALDALVIKK